MNKSDNRTTGNKLIDSLKVETEVIGFSQNQLTLYIAQTEELVKKLSSEVDRYKNAYMILENFFDYIPDEDKKKVDESLSKLNL